MANTEITYIYSLSSKLDPNSKYIGYSSTPLRRYGEHLIGKYNTTKCNWIKSLILKGELPRLELLDIVPLKEWEFWEEYYVSLYKSWGFNLVNSTFGGNGIKGYKMSKDIRENISNGHKGCIPWNKGKKLSVDHRRKLIAAKAGREFQGVSKNGKTKGITMETIENIISDYNTGNYSQLELSKKYSYSTGMISKRINQRLKGLI